MIFIMYCIGHRNTTSYVQCAFYAHSLQYLTITFWGRFDYVVCKTYTPKVGDPSLDSVSRLHLNRDGSKLNNPTILFSQFWDATAFSLYSLYSESFLSLWLFMFVCALRKGSRALLSLSSPLPQRDAKAYRPVCQNQRRVGDPTGVTAAYKALGQRPVRGGLDGYGPLPLCLATNNQTGRWRQAIVMGGVTLQIFGYASYF